MENLKYTFKHAFYYTIPILCGYLVLGMAFGVLLNDKGYNFLWALFASLIIYSGSAQFITVGFLGSGLDLFSVAMVTLLVSIRHVFYGLSMIDKFNNLGKKKLYMIFALTDETYSILCSAEVPPGVDKNYFTFFISVLNQSYWVIGSVLGSIAGEFITFNTTGIDFALTALFVIIFVDQWKKYKSHIPALTGLVSTALCLYFFGKNNFLVFSMILILFILLTGKGAINKKLGDGEGGNDL